MLPSILIFPPYAGLTFTVSVKLLPAQAASTGFPGNVNDIKSAIKSAPVNLARKFILNPFVIVMVFSLISYNKQSSSSVML